MRFTNNRLTNYENNKKNFSGLGGLVGQGGGGGHDGQGGWKCQDAANEGRTCVNLRFCRVKVPTSTVLY